MKYLGHKSDDGREQLLKDHLAGTSELCAGFASVFGMGEIGRYIGLYHDIGKYSIAFQKRIQENGIKVDHSTAGAHEFTKYNFLLPAFCIAGHHSGLMNLGSKFSTSDGSLFARKNKDLSGNLDYSNFKDELEELSIEQLQGTYKLMQEFCDKNSYTAMFLTRMLFSCLVDADYLDTEKFMNNRAVERGNFSDFLAIYNRYTDYIGTFTADNSINAKRCDILRDCIEAGKCKEGLYSLTVPTGGGKTVSSLGFALNQVMKHKKKRIIYVIPYTSIIEQTADVFRSIVGVENVVEHHMNVDYSDVDDEQQDNESLKCNEKMKLATENWDAPIIITTNVQFFESFYGNKTSKCRKLHNVADSVIIFDEAQMLPNDFLEPCVKVIEELVKNYQVTAVLCTATQPSLNKFFHNLECREICHDVDDLYNFFRRVNYKKCNKMSIDDLASEMNSRKQLLCIVNSKKDAQNVYDRLEGDGCYHLSTFMCMHHRRQILTKVRNRLKNNEECRVVATSLIEAGVDVDFPCLYRELAGLDSIIQAGGRCNRNNKNSRDDSIVFIFELEKENKHIPRFLQIPREVTKMVTNNRNDIDSLEVIKKYFDMLHNIKDEQLDKEKILKTIQEQPMCFKDIAKKFVLIEENSTGVFIPLDEKAEEILIQLKAGVRNRDLMRKAGQYMVNVYETQFGKLMAAGKLDVIDGNISVLLDLNDYDVNKGLIVNMDSSIGVFI